MVKITSSVPPGGLAGASSQHTVKPVQPTAPDRALSGKTKPFIERRKTPDRRKGADMRGPYEMRGGKDRRKSQRGRPKIDLDV